MLFFINNGAGVLKYYVSANLAENKECFDRVVPSRQVASTYIIYRDKYNIDVRYIA